MTGESGFLYLRDKQLAPLGDLEVYCRLNGFQLNLCDEETFLSRDGDLANIRGMIADYPLQGRRVFRELIDAKSRLNLPLILIMENMGETEQVEAFSEGADDIIERDTLSLNPLVLIQRLENLCRLSPGEEKDGQRSWKAGRRVITLHRAGRRISLDGRNIHITPTEWNILTLLIDEGGNPVHREVILSRCFEYQYDGYDRSIDAHVKNLRKKIPDCIETLRGVGYRFTGQDIPRGARSY